MDEGNFRRYSGADRDRSITEPLLKGALCAYSLAAAEKMTLQSAPADAIQITHWE